MQAPGIPIITPAEESKLWARWRVFNLVLSKYRVEKFKKENPNAPQYVLAEEDDEQPADGVRKIAPGEYLGGAGGSSGGGIFSMGMGAQLSPEDYAEVDRRVDEYVEHKERRREERQTRKDALRAFQPPPPPPAATAAPRKGDNLLERPGDVIARQMRPGDLIAQQPRPGDKAAAQTRPGDIAALHPQTGKVLYAHRTNSQNFTQLVVQNGQARSGDAQLSVINQFIARAQGYGECCKQDSKAKCDIKFDPKSQEALARFNEVAKNPDAFLRQEPSPADEGGPMYSPFSGSRPKPGVYGPAKGSGTQR
jgi:hypothetical protein